MAAEGVELVLEGYDDEGDWGYRHLLVRSTR
jgi:hypothetical protein